MKKFTLIIILVFSLLFASCSIAFADPANISYSLTSGAGAVYRQESDNTLEFVFKRSENDETTFAHFTGAKYDGKNLSINRHYKAKAGSLIIELMPIFLKTLQPGEKTLTVCFDDGNPVDVTFIVVAPLTHKVTFHVNGHGTAPSTQKVTDGQTATRPTSPIAQGYTFGGWFSDQACTKQFNFNTPITADITLYAKWTKSGSRATNVSSSLSIGARGDDVSAVQQRLIALGYDPGPVDGYFGSKTDAAVRAFQAANDLYIDGVVGSITADQLFNTGINEWSSPSESTSYPDNETSFVDANAVFEVIFNANGHGVAPATQNVLEGQRATRPTSPIAQGYTFGGWYTNQSCTRAFDFNKPIMADTTLYAKWTKSGSNTNTVSSSLSIGARGADVNTVQQRLTALGYDPGPVDGYFGSKTDAAVRAFQAANNLYIDGVVGPITAEKLFNAETNESFVPNKNTASEMSSSLVLGSTGSEVAAVQQKLTDLGYNPGPVDGYYGSVTESAVKAFQSANNLYVDGVVGPVTRNALFGSSAVATQNPGSDQQSFNQETDLEALLRSTYIELGIDEETIDTILSSYLQ